MPAYAPGTKLLSRAKTKEKVGANCDSSFVRIRNDPSLGFPKPVVISGGLIAWVESEVDSWIQERIRLRDEEGLSMSPRAQAALDGQRKKRLEKLKEMKRQRQETAKVAAAIE